MADETGAEERSSQKTRVGYTEPRRDPRIRTPVAPLGGWWGVKEDKPRKRRKRRKKR